MSHMCRVRGVVSGDVISHSYSVRGLSIRKWWFNLSQM